MDKANSQESTPWIGKTIDTDKLIKNIIPSGDFLNKSFDTDSFFRSLVSSLTDKPFWVKQALFLELRDDIKRMTNVELLEALDKNDDELNEKLNRIIDNNRSNFGAIYSRLEEAEKKVSNLELKYNIMWWMFTILFGTLISVILYFRVL